MLEDRTAIIYGGGGAIGAAVAQAFARAGATVHLVGRTRDRLTSVAASIRASGGAAEIATLDVTDRSAVHAHAATVAKTAGRIDVAFNATANDDIQGTPLVDMPVSEVLQPVVKAVTAHLNIGTAMAAQMKAQQSGVILVMGGGREAIPLLGGAHVAWTALAGLCRQLACELAPHGVRVAWLLSPGSPDDDEQPDPYAELTLLHRRPTLADVANVATFLASDHARTMTATEVNITAGAVID